MALEIICQDNALGRKLVERLLPQLAADTLAVAQIRWQGEGEEPDLPAAPVLEDDEEEAFDEYDDGDGEGGGVAF